jgi:ribokinase
VADVVVVGSLAMDFTTMAPRLPQPGETVLGDEFLMVPGGKGSNQAVAVARQGASTAMIGCIGGDALGDAIVEVHRAEGIDPSSLTRDAAHDTGIAQIMVDGGGENVIVVVPRANHALDAARVDAQQRLIAGAKVLLVQLEIPLDAVVAALGHARAAGVTTILNPAPAASLPDDLLAMVDICVPNETEAEVLCLRPVDDLDGAVEAGRMLLARGVGAALVTLGPRGAVYVDADRHCEVDPFRVDAVDATAAGDAFCGAFAAALAADLTVEAALRRASAAGALATTVRGASPSLPDAAAVDALVR